MLRRLALLALLHAQQARRRTTPCDLTPATVARINDWILNGNDPGNNAFEALTLRGRHNAWARPSAARRRRGRRFARRRASARIATALCGNRTTSVPRRDRGGDAPRGRPARLRDRRGDGRRGVDRYFGRGSFFGSPSRTALFVNARNCSVLKKTRTCR